MVERREVGHIDTRCGEATRGILERREVWWSDATFVGAVEQLKVWYSDNRCGDATRVVVERRELSYTYASFG